MTGFRLDDGGVLIDRSRPLTFACNGVQVEAFEGDTVASALLAAGTGELGSSVQLGRPRGVVGLGVEDSVALIQVHEPFPEPMLAATMLPAQQGLSVTGLPGQGRLATDPDPARYDARHIHCDVLVVGAGPAGLTAAAQAAQQGQRVILIDEGQRTGGQLLSAPSQVDGQPGHEWAARLTEDLIRRGVRVLTATTVFGLYDDGFALAVERRTGAGSTEGVTRQRIWRIRATKTVIATGAHERPIAFTDNDLPGVMLASAAAGYLYRYGVAIGQRVVVFTTNDSAYSAAWELARAGVQVVAIVDARPQPPQALLDESQSLGIRVQPGTIVTAALGTERVTGARLHRLDELTGTDAAGTELDCDAIAVSGGWNPVVHLYSHLRGELIYDPTRGCFLPAGNHPRARVIGAAAGEPVDLGDHQLATAARNGIEPILVLWSVPDPTNPPTCTRFVDLQRDATVADVTQAVGAGMRSVEHVKRYTTIGTAHDQGKTSGVLASGVVSGLLGVDVAALGTTTFRPPYTQVAFAALAGRHRGQLLEPVRRTAIHAWHIEHGALFENVGQWKRPWFYPQGGEDLHAAVRRETIAARTAVAMMDGSTLGKIDIQGPDAAEFMDRMYTNLMSTLKVGSVRYGLMCGPDGMVIDDGTVLRLGDQQYLATTTTGNAAKILEWLEEWQQTEWPHLDVWFTSVTEHWATFPVVGPRSRDVIGTVTDLDASNDAFGFMTWKDTQIDGIDVRIARISFSGELAYEVNVPWAHALHIWETLWAAGQPLGITAYGTETMHVLRAEKGYPIIGQDTDGTITPYDLGMSWIVSKKKPDFVGKRSLARASMHEPDRKHLVGLLPVDRSTVLLEGGQIVEVEHLPAPPVPMLGHVTSSYPSAALDSPFALALVKGGRDRIGQTVYVTQSDARAPMVAATVVDSVLFDPEGARRDG